MWPCCPLGILLTFHGESNRMVKQTLPHPTPGVLRKPQTIVPPKPGGETAISSLWCRWREHETADVDTSCCPLQLAYGRRTTGSRRHDSLGIPLVKQIVLHLYMLRGSLVYFTSTHGCPFLFQIRSYVALICNRIYQVCLPIQNWVKADVDSGHLKTNIWTPQCHCSRSWNFSYRKKIKILIEINLQKYHHAVSNSLVFYILENVVFKNCLLVK